MQTAYLHGKEVLTTFTIGRIVCARRSTLRHWLQEQEGAARVKAGADQFAANVMPIVESIRSSGVEGLTGIAEALNKRGVRTARGGRWHASTVKNLLAR